jgi:hypothetical protein
MGKLLGFGVLLWASVFISSFIIFPLKLSNPPFFETLISIILCLFTVIASIIYFKDFVPGLKKGVSTGIIWMILNIVIDLPLFSFGPMKKPLTDYFTDIGLTYLIIPIITTGMALVLKNAPKNFNSIKNG